MWLKTIIQVLGRGLYVLLDIYEHTILHLFTFQTPILSYIINVKMCINNSFISLFYYNILNIIK
jgi:hypothetical protein